MYLPTKRSSIIGAVPAACLPPSSKKVNVPLPSILHHQHIKLPSPPSNQQRSPSTLPWPFKQLLTRKTPSCTSPSGSGNGHELNVCAMPVATTVSDDDDHNIRRLKFTSKRANKRKPKSTWNPNCDSALPIRGISTN
ncbi:hypothetical protein THAOC_07274 [Thalassiosira oceanica]|uniref:Uncharacterized protein n=1 Tax=Thalassiosira oceanica TaxID=159749 RepID=K0TKR4_THAOC|nr:hypothetical protein THAOC_07274 [Thalassiosira oceanica]|eukprot:EJK71307.1 hypothetical protein THAOC_07274 [Thalassiosira oceanica]